MNQLLGKPNGSSEPSWTRPSLRRSKNLDAETECAPTSTAFVTLQKLSEPWKLSARFSRGLRSIQVLLGILM